MIDFRYHLVSIVAIFLALSVGIVLGTTLLEDPVIKASESLANQLREGNNELRDQVEVLQRREAANDAFVVGDTSRLVQDALVGKSIVIVEAPGSTASVREAAQQVIEEAGGNVTGRITLTERFIDPAQAGFVDKLAVGAKAAETVFSVEDTAYDKAAEVLAGAILTSDSSQVGKEHPAGAGILDAFQRGGLLTVTDEPARRADAALVIAPAEAYVGETAGEQAGALVTLALGLDDAGQGTVLAGTQTSAAPGGVITALREDAAFMEKVSSVDTADMPSGRVVVVYALREQLTGLAGQYGIGPGVSGIEPSATPTPTATTTAATATSGG
ncbi:MULTISPECIES: copper transporter [unclassified Streptosporangium]|uniref:copper transporter n=1 Tax=unclassified Streptosporangium TaxID=2632669 RepID=UPI002E2B0534|nr:MULTISPECIES: copper transporter [unclassified Streptosporangium]